MVDPAPFRSDELFAVLERVASGATTVPEIAQQLSDSEPRVQEVLEWGVGADVVAGLDLPSGQAYSLTAHGLTVLGMAQGVNEATGPTGRVSLVAVARMAMQGYAGAHAVAVEEALRDQADWLADDSGRDLVTSALADAYARGALTKEQLDDRTTRALSATTMGELRSAGDGVIELHPWLPTGVTSTQPAGGLRVQESWVNPALREVRWARLVWVGLLFLVGMVLMSAQPVAGAAALLLAVGLGLWILRPFLSSGTTTIK